MKKIYGLVCISGIMLCCLETTCHAQSSNSGSHNLSVQIPEVALLDLESTTPSSLVLSPASPTEAGNALDLSTATNQTIWLNYSSVIGARGTHRTITAYLEGTIPEGLAISIKASSYSGNGKGKTGVSTGKIHLSEKPQNIITHIGSCYTGDGINNGHLLTYSLEPGNHLTDYETLAYEKATTLNVIYTLTDNH
jgi:hypothetical protein